MPYTPKPSSNPIITFATGPTATYIKFKKKRTHKKSKIAPIFASKFSLKNHFIASTTGDGVWIVFVVFLDFVETSERGSVSSDISCFLVFEVLDEVFFDTLGAIASAKNLTLCSINC